MIKLVTISFALSFILGGCSNLNNDQIKEEVLIPNGHKGCSYVVYNTKGAPKLEKKDDKIIYKLNEKGVIATSSSEKFGWSDPDSDTQDVETKYYYVDESGNKIDEIPLENIQQAGIGSSSKPAEGKKEIKFMHFFIGNQEEYRNFQESTDTGGCFGYEEILEKVK